MRVTTILVTLTAAAPAFADGAIVKSCDWSAAGSCPFNAMKGTDYLIHVSRRHGLRGHHPAGEPGRAGHDEPLRRQTYRQLRRFERGVPSSGPPSRARSSSATCRRRGRRPDRAPPTPTVVTDCRADAKTHLLPARRRPPQSRTSTRPTATPTGSSSPTCAAAGCTRSPPPRWTSLHPVSRGRREGDTLAQAHVHAAARPAPSASAPRRTGPTSSRSRTATTACSA